MTMVGDPGRRGLLARVQGILLRPTAEWHVIDAEPATTNSLFTRYAVILAAIGPICGLLGGLLFAGPTYARLGIPVPVVGLVVGAILNYVISLIAVFVFGLVIEAMAPTFGGVKDRTKAMKVAVYSATAAWVAGVFGLIPMLGILGLLGLYSIFLLYRGLPILMRSPQERATGYTAVVVLIMIVVWIVLGLLMGAVAVMTGVTPGFGALMHAAQTHPASY